MRGYVYVMAITDKLQEIATPPAAKGIDRPSSDGAHNTPSRSQHSSTSTVHTELT